MTASLPRSTPEAQGVPSRAIAAFVDAAERDVQYLHSLVVARGGHVIAEGYWAPFDGASPHMLFSLSKSFTSSAIGMLVGDGRLKVADKVLDFFPDEAPANPSPYLRQMTVHNLLTMNSGHDVDPTRAIRQAKVDWVRAFFEAPLVHEPGTRFVYNSGATYMCSAIAQKITGQRLLDFLGPRLFEPLGIENPTWEQSPQGIDTGGWGLKVRTAEIARFGQLYLQRGVWQGKRLIPEEWVAAATSAQVPNASPGNPNEGKPDWEQGYGYQFWRCRHNAYRGDGAHGQYCLVLPDQEVVIATTSGTVDLQRVLDLVWEHLLPAFGAVPLPADPAASDALEQRLAGLKLPTPTGAAASSTPRRGYTLDDNDAGVRQITFEDGAVVLDGQRLQLGYGEWIRGELSLPNFPSVGQPASSKVAAAAAWTDERTLEIHLWSYETPFRNVWRCRFDGDRLHIDRELHPAGRLTPPLSPMEGRAAVPVA